jgi:uncharacterized C2H2 Zn-finger protein
MRLQVGERLEGSGPQQQPGGYVITSVVRETPWHGLYAGKKIFYNFDFTAKRVRETDELEWLDVFIRTNRYPVLDDPAYVQARRALARAEVRGVLGNRHSNLWPEPLDLLEIENTRDPFTFADDWARSGEPIVVYTRPQGRFTPEWQQQVLPISSILSVLAEVLEFIRLAHSENLLLLGLSPASLLIDGSDRVHFVGSDMVLAQQSALLKDTTPIALWQRLFPADRFVRGYTAPECFDPNRRPDVRTDLYAWGAFGCSLLGGVNLSKLAQEQGRPWATPGDGLWRDLESTLLQYPKNTLFVWAEQIGVEPARLIEGWPTNIVHALRLLMNSEAARRPGSVSELQAWIVEPPPPPVADVIALHTDADTAKLLLDCTGVDAGLELTVQCAPGAAPRAPADGATVAEGPMRPVIGVDRLPMTTDSIFFTVFTRRHANGRAVHSSGVVAQLWQPNEANLRQWVEEQAAGSLDAQHIPTRVGMVLGALDARLTADSLLASKIPRVRAWCLKRIEQTVRAQRRLDSAESLLWRFLAEPNADLRQTAATTLWSFHPKQNDDLLLRVVEALEAAPIDAPIPLMQFLRGLKIAEPRIRLVLHQLETRRPTECPLCKKPLTIGERAAHLQAEHGYLVYQGDVLPVDAVIARLWERVLDHQDQNAHEELTGMYLRLPAADKNQDKAVECYLADLRRFLFREVVNGDAPRIPVAIAFESITAFQLCVRASPWFLPIARHLLASDHARLHDLGVQSALPYLQDQLRGKANVNELRKALTTLGDSLDQIDVQIGLCRQLGQVGVDPALLQACITQLQEERLTTCPECRANVRTRDLELHLRRAHQIYQFRGERGDYPATRGAIVRAICTPPADVAAWKSLTSLAGDTHPQDPERSLLVWLYQHLKDADGEKRSGAVTTFGDVLIAAESADAMMPILVDPDKHANWAPLGRRLALEVCARLPVPAPAKVLPQVLPLLDNKELSRRLRENAVLALMRSIGKDGPMADSVLRAFVANSSKKRSVEKLHQFEHRFGHSLALDALVKEIEDEIRMSCPRCPTELRKKDMVEHLWDAHHLVLDGQRVREPWRVIEDWIVDYGLEKDPQVLKRCRELALKDDPRAGLARLLRMLYRRGLRDRELLKELRASIQSQKATLCPHCCATVSIAPLETVQPLTLSKKTLEGHGYRIDLAETGLIPKLHIETPDTILFHDREPGRFVTRLGGILFLIVPLVVGTFAVLRWFTEGEISPLVLTAVAFGVGLVGAALLYIIWPDPRPARARLLKAAWNLLVPDMLQETMDRRAWSFLHGLFDLSDDGPRQRLHPDLLRECGKEVSDGGNDPIALQCLAVLGRRCLADMRDAGEEALDLLAGLAADCFKGKLPLTFLSDLLESFAGDERSAWSKCDLHRLPIVVAQCAFATEMELDDWFNLGRAFPVMQGVLNLDSRWHWLQFHALWSQLNRRPWENAGPALTMRDLAKAPGEYEDLLTYYPDVLLYVSRSNLVMGTKGVWIEGVCVTAWPPGTDVSMQRVGGGEFEITVGHLRIRTSENPQAYLDDIKRWLRWYFQEFVPGVMKVAVPLTESRHRMWQASKVTCMECGKALVPCPGDLGVALR